MQPLARTLQYFLKKKFAPENIKNWPQKLLIIKPIFSVLIAGSKPAQISISVP